LDWSADTVAAYDARLGKVPYDFGLFISVPETPEDTTLLNSAVDQIAAVHSNLYLTVEIPEGLQSITPSVAQTFAQQLAGFNARGVGIWLRFGQEMNGSWYIWGQQPTAYISAFQLMAQYVHRLALGTVMVWSPNYGGGYPYLDEAYNAKPGTPQFQILDTAGSAGLSDGGQELNQYDDPYGPYYPGDASVDWVALTLYHFGNEWPWGPNNIPEADTFVDQITGRYDGGQGDERMVPNFYQVYAVGHHKPFAISETAALYDLANAGTGASELQLKSDWIHQVYNPAVRAEFPDLGLVNWFEHEKYENGIQGMIDWRDTVNPDVKAVLLQATSTGYVFARG
jgi:hypothetical protein